MWLVCLSVCLCVCLCVCLSVHEHISLAAGPIFTNFFVQISCGRGSVLLWWRSNTLCTYGLMDDITFGCNGPYGDAWKAEPLTYYYEQRCDTGAESDVYECLVVNGIMKICFCVFFVSISSSHTAVNVLQLRTRKQTLLSVSTEHC